LRYNETQSLRTATANGSFVPGAFGKWMNVRNLWSGNWQGTDEVLGDKSLSVALFQHKFKMDCCVSFTRYFVFQCFNTKYYIIITSIQPLGRFWQEPEPSQATGMALAHCILDTFLGVVCHCFPLPLYVPTFAARCLHVSINATAPSSERWNWVREWFGNFAKMAPF
jgi:hypothetical protein